jgi:penicillin-binding protein 1A
MDYMGRVLAGIPDEGFVAPEGVVAANVNPATGLRSEKGDGRVLEYFYQESVPAEDGGDGGVPEGSTKHEGKGPDHDDQLY